ncbi:hypothetical protein [Desulfohalobium retbaense]|uniref:Uncharacterized protein n=1 Tax=Desulfohalobium retbaense (strain ATCC 49708 / DSM 5692 / JCM 16813 / HR100) TaxID=485915 RepID=C8X4C5_DESRD|nr:hypothetical protein [Desulfohalobium retbaense]ACV69399.1 hypothetical protein Dret_2115 [Desulfohalobium retbaense DSM 5692]
MQKHLKILQDLAKDIAELDERIVEVFIHSDAPRDPFDAEEIYLVCSLTDPEIANDIEVYNDAGFAWSLEMQDKIEPLREAHGIGPEIILAPFNFVLHAEGEYGEYYSTLFLREGYAPVLKMADEQQAKREQAVFEDAEPVQEDDPV